MVAEYLQVMTSRGRVTVPREVRERLGLHAGAALRFSVDDDGRVVLTRAETSLSDGYGAVPPLTRPEDFRALRDEAIGERVGRGRAGE